MSPNPHTSEAPPAGAQVLGLVPGVSYFQVLEPAPLVGPHGEQAFSMTGPYLDLARASQVCNARPGSLITVTLVLYQAPPAGMVAAIPKANGHAPPAG